MYDYSTTISNSKNQNIWVVVTTIIARITLIAYIYKQSDIYPENELNGTE